MQTNRKDVLVNEQNAKKKQENKTLRLKQVTSLFSSPRISSHVIRLEDCSKHLMTTCSSMDEYQNVRLVNYLNSQEYHSRINLYEQNLNDHDVSIVIRLAIEEKRCTELWLEKNQITHHGASMIANALKNNQTLQWLSLSSNRLLDNGVEILATILTDQNSTLTSLGLHATGMTDHGVKYIAEMLKQNQTLMELGLSGNDISDDGMKILTEALTFHNRTLRWLYLSKNRLISDASIECLLQMFGQNRKLQVVSIDDCNLSSDGQQRLQLYVQSKTSFSLKT